MSLVDREEQGFAEGFIGVSTQELMAKSDADLAVWQAGWKPGTEKHILAEKEWARRLGVRQLREQFRLEERLAQRNRWWGLGAAALGVVGTVVGALLGVHLARPSAPDSAASSASLLQPLGQAASQARGSTAPPSATASAPAMPPSR